MSSPEHDEEEETGFSDSSENATMGVQNNYFVRKRPFSMGCNGGYGFKNSRKNKIQIPARKKHPLSTHWVAMVAV